MGRIDHRWVSRCAVVIGVAALVCPAAAAAEENGLRVGSGRLHPSLELEGRFDSYAVEAGDGSDPNPVVAPDFIVHVRPGLDYSVDTPSVAFNLDAEGDLNVYTGVSVNTTRKLTYFGGLASMNLSINPTGQVGFELGDRFSHSDLNSAVSLGSGIRSFYNEAYGALPIRPGGGAIEIRPHYAFAFEAFTAVIANPIEITDPAQLNYLSHRPGLDAKWKFLPKTALVVDVSADLRSYGDPVNTPVNALYARAGLTGLITPKVSIVAAAGYGNSFIGAAAGIPNYSSVIGNAEIAYVPSPTARLKLGFARTFKPVPLHAWFGDNQIYANGSVLVSGRFLGTVGLRADLINYATGRFDQLFSFDLGAGIRLTEWLEAEGGYRLTLRNSQDDPSNSFVRHEAFARLTARY